jgi:DNA-binding NtrC family response regulator
MMDDKPILIVDDEPSMRMALSESLASCGYRIETAVDGQDALRKLSGGSFRLVITDMRMPKLGGMDVLKSIKLTSPETKVIVITAYGTINTAVEAMKEGASEFIMKPFSLEDLERVVKTVLNKKGPEGEPSSGPARSEAGEIVTGDPGMLALLDMLKSVARSKSTVLVQGESGTGKELIARYIHRNSSRSHMPFVAINCAAVPHNLLESEMFGFEKGAFTGAAQRRIGKFEMADGGTLLLDEISEMDIQLQAKLLRAIQESEIDRLGGREPVPVEVRIIATTNSDLKRDIKEKRFREDLYYRLNVIPARVPPLRERQGDVPLLVDYFLTKHAKINRKKKPRVSGEAMAMLKEYNWPGNVRELENVIERAVLISNEEPILPIHLILERDEIHSVAPKEEAAAMTAAPPAPSGNPTLREMEKSLIFETLKGVKGNKTKASKILGISVRTMRNKLNEYKIESAVD